MGLRIAFSGAGSIGSMTGGLMAKAGQDVTLVDQWPEHVAAINRSGLRLSGTVGDQTVRVRAIGVHELQREQEPFDVVFVTVKSYDTQWAAALFLQYSTPETCFVSLQNCINEDRLAQVAGRERTLGCVTTISTGLYEPGHVVRTDSLASGKYQTGELDGSDTPRVREVAKALSGAGTSLVTAKLMNERWSKLAVNCTLNALCGLTGMKTNEVIEHPKARRIGALAAAEAITVASAEGYPVSDAMTIPSQMFLEFQRGRGVEELEQAMLAYAKKTQNTGMASFGQDVLKGRRTEIDYINGHVASKGDAHGIATPACDALVADVKASPAGQLKPDRAAIDRLYAKLF